MDPLRIGVLGTARISALTLLGAAASVPEVTVAAVAARDQSRAAAYAEQHGIPVAYGGYDALLASPDIDAVYNPLPNSLHGPWTLKAIAAGKHVLCEKPFTSNAEEAELVADAAAASGLVVMEAMHYRYHPLIRRLRELVGELGPVRHIQCWTSFVISDEDDIRYDYDLGGGALMDGGCYAIDCLRLLGPGEPEVTAALADPYLRIPGRGPDRAGAAADRAMAVRLAFPDDATAWFESAFTLDGEFRADVHVSCQHGHVLVQDFIRAHWGHLVAIRNGSVLADERGSGDTTYTEQLRAFAAAIAGAGSVPTSAPVSAPPVPAPPVSAAPVPAPPVSAAPVSAAPVSAPPVSTAEHAVTTMRLIDDAYRAAGLLPRGA